MAEIFSRGKSAESTSVESLNCHGNSKGKEILTTHHALGIMDIF
jgi:hypothetical protein